MTLDFTIAIPTYNGGDRIPALLEKLRSQTQVDQLAWEILIVDNNSSDNTCQIVEQYQADATFPVPIRYAFEPQQGAAYARLTAIGAANGEWIGFLDDDNWPEPNWLSVAAQFRHHRPRLGAFSGRIRLATDASVPSDFNRIAIYLAIRDHGHQPCAFDPDNLLLPPAASLVIRKQAWIESVPKLPTLSGKRPGFFVQGDDYEPLLYLHKAGWEIWYTPDLQTHHQLSAQRFERDYLIRLAYACGLATCQLRLVTATAAQAPKIMLRTVLGGLKRSLLLLLTHRYQTYQDIALRTELAFHWGSVISPWICWRLRKP
ncbi:MAG: hormogonium polysaccharide biosynthesis glycosyltransferase HpsE [Thainema sp.]